MTRRARSIRRFLVEEEGTASTLQALLEVFSAHGLPSSLYTDRGSHYFHTPEADGPVDKTRLTQVGRALKHLGVEHIPAYSPEARGRCERMFGTLQDRLIKELAKAGITEIDAANRWIREVYLPAHNARFAKPAALPESAFVTADAALLAETLCVQEERVVGPRQHGELQRAQTAAARKPAARAFRQGAGARSPLSRRRARRVPRPALHRPLRRAAGSRRSPQGSRRTPSVTPCSPPSRRGLEAPRAAAARGATASLDGGCARRHVARAGRDEETVPRSNQETDTRQQRDRRHTLTSPTPAGASTASKPAGSFNPRSGQVMCYQNRTS